MNDDSENSYGSVFHSEFSDNWNGFGVEPFHFENGMSFLSTNHFNRIQQGGGSLGEIRLVNNDI